jgi:hypothetical protein
MTLNELVEAASQCLAFINQYGTAHAALVRQSLAMKDVPGGPWRGYFARDGGENGIGYHLSGAGIISEVDGRAVIKGSGILCADNPHAAFHDFRLIDPNGDPPSAGSEAEAEQVKYEFYLHRTRDMVEGLRAVLPTIESLHVEEVETVALTQMRLALPEPPYIPVQAMTHTVDATTSHGLPATITATTNRRGLPSDQWEQYLADEQALIEDARLVLHRLVALAQRQDFQPLGKLTSEGGRNERRGRLQKDEGEAKRAQFLATIHEHPSLKDDMARLAEIVGISESTARRWLEEELSKYRNQRDARRDTDKE